MDLEQYMAKKATELTSLIQSSPLTNQYGQMFAKKMGAQFKQTYDETSVWRMALFLSSVGVRVLTQGDRDLGVYSLKLAAEIYETLSIMSDEYDREFMKIMSALTYDIAGYSANARCLVDGTYQLDENDQWDQLTNYLLRYASEIIVGRFQTDPPWHPPTDVSPLVLEVQGMIQTVIERFKRFALFGESTDFAEEQWQDLIRSVGGETMLYTLLILVERQIIHPHKREKRQIIPPPPRHIIHPGRESPVHHETGR